MYDRDFGDENDYFIDDEDDFYLDPDYWNSEESFDDEDEDWDEDGNYIPNFDDPNNPPLNAYAKPERELALV